MSRTLNLPSTPTNSNGQHFFNTFLAICLGVSFAISVITLVAKQTLLNYDLNMQIITDQKIDQKIAVLIPGVIFDELTGNSAPAVSALLADPTNGIAATIIPSDWVKLTLRQSVRGAIDTLESGSEKFSFTIDLAPIKQQIENTSVDLTARVIALMPNCKAEQILSFAGSAVSGTSSALPFCKPGEPFTRLITPTVAGWISGLGSQIPASFELPLVSLTAADQNSPYVRVIRVIQALTPIGKVAPFISLILLAAILGINWKTLASGLHWIGIAFLITAGLLVITLVITARFAPRIDLSAGGAQPWMAQMTQILLDYLSALMIRINGMLIKLAAVLGGGGGLLLLLVRKNKFAWQD